MTTNELGRTTSAGFLPNEPKTEDIFSRLNLLKNGVDGLKGNPGATHLAEPLEVANAEIKRSYARFYHGTAAPSDQKAILEDLLDRSLRRAPMTYRQGVSMEEFAAEGLMRGGQNDMVVYILLMMQQGIDLPAPKAKKPRKK